MMDKMKFIRLIGILITAAVGFSLLSSSGSNFRCDISQLKALLMYILLGASAYAIFLNIKGTPGL